MAKRVTVRRNERSWAIELISQINSIADNNDLKIKRAGGETTISGLGNSMFPDVLLYEDRHLNNILQGWELKMPDVPITDEVFVNDAQRKARALGLDSCVIWNFTYAKFYVLDPSSNTFNVVKEWSNHNITTRPDVETYRTDWETTLKDVVLTVNEYFQTHTVRPISICDIISQNAIDTIIEKNKDIAGEYLESHRTDSVIDATISAWWNNTKSEYTLDEINQYKAYAKHIILNWTFRIIFAHLIKRTQNGALLIDNIAFETTPEEANAIFEQITRSCDFFNVFEKVDLNEHIPAQTWADLVELSLFLKENGLNNINQVMLQNVLENCVNTTRRELNGQYPTPKILAYILTHITVRDWNVNCIDPCCGTATIAKEFLTGKKEKRASNPIETTWASDKYKTPLQIANVSLTSSDSINKANRIFQKNALDLKIGDCISIVNPENGEIINYSVPQFGAICSNLPFVTQENIPVDDRVHIPNNNFELDGRSDLSFYIALHLDSLLNENGFIGIITSNSWLGSNAGDIFFQKLNEKFDLLQVHISGEGRWFKNADVVTTILILRKKQNPSNNSIKFFTWKKKLEDIESNNQYRDCIINSSLLEREIDPNIVSISEYSLQDIQNLKSLNVSYNALFNNINWLLPIANSLVPIDSIFDVIRGSRRGWDPLFFPENNTNIESTFLKPAFFNARNTTHILSTPDRVAFCCNVDLQVLQNSYPNAYNWVCSFQNVLNGRHIPLPQVLARTNQKWYEMTPNEVVSIYTMMNPNDRFFFGRFAVPTFINQRLIGLKPKSGFNDVILYSALLNSLLVKFFIEAVGFGRGLGVLDITRQSIAKCQMLNPNLLSIVDQNSIKQDYINIIEPKQILNIEDELNDSEWISYNKKILSAFGIGDYYDQIKNSLLSLRKIRNAVKI